MVGSTTALFRWVHLQAWPKLKVWFQQFWNSKLNIFGRQSLKTGSFSGSTVLLQCTECSWTLCRPNCGPSVAKLPAPTKWTDHSLLWDRPHCLVGPHWLPAATKGTATTVEVEAEPHRGRFCWLHILRPFAQIFGLRTHKYSTKYQRPNIERASITEYCWMEVRDPFSGPSQNIFLSFRNYEMEN